RAHARKGLPVLVVAHSGQQSHFRESAIPVVVVQEALHRVIGHKDIGETVAVVIGKTHSQALAVRIRYTGFGGDIGERAVAIVVVERVAPIAGYVNVFEAVVVIVAYRDPHAVVILRHSGQTGLLGDVGEGAIRILVI